MSRSGDEAGPSSRVEIRRAVAGDAEVITDVYLRSRRGAGLRFPPGVHPDVDVRWYVDEVVVPIRETWVASAGGVVVGVASLDGDDLDWLFIDPDHQGTGVGSALLDHVKARRPDGFELWVFVSNEPARSFYERHGLHEVHRTDGEHNEEHAPDVRLRWPGRTT